MGRRRSAPHTIQRCEALACFALARRVGGGPQPAPGVLGLVAHPPITTPAPSVASVTHSYPPHHNLSYTSTMKFTLALLILGCAMIGAEAKSAEASHILVKDESKCKELMESIKGGSVAFADAAKEHSTCPSGKSGGSLGEFGPGMMQKPFEDASFSLEVGEISGVVESDSGLHIILRLE